MANTDDPDMPVNTLRAWTIGILWSIILPGMNQFFFFRYPTVTVTGVSAPFLRRYDPAKKSADYGTTPFLPSRTIMGVRRAVSEGIRNFPESRALHGEGACADHDHGERRVPVCLRGEQCRARVCLTSLTSPQTDIIAVQRVFYNQIFSFGYQWMMLMSTQLVRPLEYLA